MPEVDYCDEDMPIPGQLFVCLSFMTPERVRGCETYAVKVRGVYNTKERAQQRVDEIMKEDPLFDVWIGEVGKWGAVTNDPSKAEDVEYQEKELQKLAKAHKEAQAEAKRVEKERKLDMLKSGDYDDTNKGLTSKKTAEKLKQKLKEKQAKKELLEETENKINSINKEELLAKYNKETSKEQLDLKNAENEVKEKSELSSSELSRIQETSELVQQKEKELNDADKNIDRIKKLYAKFKEKQENL